jgi:hypothetical protein
MQFLAYVAVVLVSLTGILVELDWLTKPKLETSSPVQVATSIAPAQALPRVDGPTQGPSPVTKPAVAADAATTGSSVRDEQHDAGAQSTTTAAPVTPSPFPAAVAAKADVAKPDVAKPDVATADVAKADVPSTPIAPQAPAAAPKVSEAVQTVAAPPAQEPAKEQTKAQAKEEQPKAQVAKAPAAVEPQPTLQPAAQPVAAKTANACDIQACSGAYTSFRASDCSYQPTSGGARRVCDKAPGATPRIAAKPRRDAMPREALARDPGARRQSRDAELRDVERVVRRMTSADADADPRMEQRMDARMSRRMGRSQVILMDRDDSDW